MTPVYSCRNNTPAAGLLDHVVARLHRDMGAPAVGFVLHAGERLAGAVGVCAEDGLQADADTLFPIGSLTKAFTAAATLASGEALDDPLSSAMLPSGAAALTPRLILSGQTGLAHRDEIVLRAIFDRREPYLDAALRLPRRSRGTGDFAYSNAMFTLAGARLEKRLGVTWDRAIGELILTPLGMKATRAADGRVPDVPAAMPHLPDALGRPIAQGFGLYGREMEEGAGALFSTPRDMARWLAYMLGDGTAPSASGLTGLPGLLMTTQTPVREDPLARLAGQVGEQHRPSEAGYAFGWFTHRWRGTRLIHHSGGFGGAMSYIALVPELGLGIVLLANMRVRRPLLQASCLAALDAAAGWAGPDWMAAALALPPEPSFFALDPPPAVTGPAAAPLAEYCGAYRNPVLGESLRIVLDGAALRLEAGLLRATLFPLGGHAFLLRAQGRLEGAYEDVVILPPPDNPGAIGSARRAAAWDRLQRL